MTGNDPVAGRSNAAPAGVERRLVVDMLGRVAEIQLRTPADVTEMLRELNVRTVAEVPGAQSAGITVAGPHRQVRTVAATDSYPAVLDDAQRRTGEGPCLSAAWEHHTMQIDDLWSDGRWLHFRAVVVQRTPIRSVLSFRLYDDGKSMAALNLFSTAPRAFDQESLDMGLIHAAHTAVSWNVMRREGQFRSALGTRDVIGQAKGILMERFDLDAYEAFELLRKISQDSNAKLIDVAERLTHRHRTGDHPPTEP